MVSPSSDSKTIPPDECHCGRPVDGDTANLGPAARVHCVECLPYRCGDQDPSDCPFLYAPSDAPPTISRRYIVGTYCPRGGGHFDLMGDEDYDGSCGSKGWPLFIEVEDGDDLSSLPEGYFADEQP